jgi:hypothetical protein
LAEQKLGMPITLFLDNARYQKCALVMSTAEKLQIEPMFFADLFTKSQSD